MEGSRKYAWGLSLCHASIGIRFPTGAELDFLLVGIRLLTYPHFYFQPNRLEEIIIEEYRRYSFVLTHLLFVLTHTVVYYL